VYWPQASGSNSATPSRGNPRPDRLHHPARHRRTDSSVTIPAVGPGPILW
jgi:hypothetical protein